MSRAHEVAETAPAAQHTGVPSGFPAPDFYDYGWLAWLAVAGAAIGLGQLLASEERLTWRIVVGRALSSAALGASSTLVLIWFPALPMFVLVGIACTVASLGTSGLERVVQLILQRR